MAFFVLLFVGQTSASAQQLPNQCAQIKYSEPTDHRQYRLDQIEGQAAYGAVSDRGEFRSAVGLCVALFNRSNKQLVAVVTTEKGGEFHFKDPGPGRYLLIASLTPLHEVIVPLARSQSGTRTHKDSRLLLHMRSKEDSRKSFLTRVVYPALRRELLRRAEHDQAVRNDLIKSGMDHPDRTLEKRVAAIDSRNTERMKEIVRKYGWPGTDLVGLDGAEAAFLLVQHAEHRFHKAMLPFVRKAYGDGGLSPDNYAVFVDRLLTDEGKPQLYGTRAKPIAQWPGKVPALYPIADEINVDKRRAELGLPPLSEYLRTLKQIYFPER